MNESVTFCHLRMRYDLSSFFLSIKSNDDHWLVDLDMTYTKTRLCLEKLRIISKYSIWVGLCNKLMVVKERYEHILWFWMIFDRSKLLKQKISLKIVGWTCVVTWLVFFKMAHDRANYRKSSKFLVNFGYILLYHAELSSYIERTFNFESIGVEIMPIDGVVML